MANLTLLSWNSDSRINDGTNFNGILEPGVNINLKSQAVYADRAENWPLLSGTVLSAHSIQLKFTLPGSNTANFISTQRDLLKAIFNIADPIPHQLIAKDENTKQWQRTGIPVSLDADQSAPIVTFLVTLALSDPVWRSVTTNTNSQAVTTSPTTWTVTQNGTIKALPIFKFTPTTARTSQWLYVRWCSIYMNTVFASVNYPLDITDGGINTANLVNDTSVSNQINQVGGINNSVTTIPINTPVGGGLPASGMGYVGTEQISWTGNSAGNLTGVTRGIGGTTAASHANGAVIARSKMLANGNDIRVGVDGSYVNYWLSGINTSSTKIWIAQNWSSPPNTANAPVASTLRTALPNNGTAVTVQFTKSVYTSLLTLKAMKASANNVFLIGTEAFTYNPLNVDLVNYQITSCTRAAKYTSFAAHSVGATIIPLEHDIFLYYGNSAASAADVDNTQQPLLDLTNSTNTSWVQTSFFDNTSVRPAQWNGQVATSTGNLSSIYSANQNTYANPATELGMRLLNYQIANVWKAETATIIWSFYHPAGITTVSMAGSKYALNNVAWPTIAGLQYPDATGQNWRSVWNESAPASSNTWSNFTHNTVSLSGTKNNIRVALSGTIAATASNEADIQMDTITLALDNTKTPSISLGTEQTSSGFYYLNIQLANNTVLDINGNATSFTLTGQIPLNTTITVDCNAKTVTLADGTNAYGYLTVSTVRNNWLELASGANSLTYTDTGTGNCTVETDYQDWML